MLTRRIVLILGIILLVILGGWFFSLKISKPETEKDSNKLQIVTTFAPLYIFTKNIVGEYAEVHNLLSGGVGPHNYAFAPSDVMAIAKADVLIKQGRSIDKWVDEAVETAGSDKLVLIVAGDGILPHTGSTSLDIETGKTSSFSKAQIVKPNPEDPHLWVDPYLAIREVENIRNGLMQIDPIHAKEYASQAEEYLLKLLTLDREARGAFANLMNRDFVSFHPAFRYFAYEYGLREVAVIEEIPGEEPTPQDLIKIATDIQKTGVKVILVEPQFSPKIAEILAKDYGLRIAELDPLEVGELRQDYYEEVVRKNIKAIVESFID